MERVERRARAIRTIAVDLAAARVARALRAAGVPCILLKGPALAALLYEPGELRPYVDVDLLVAPSDEPPAGEVLRGLGYQPLVTDEALAGHRRLHAHEWCCAGDPSVDLHRTLPGAAAEPAAVVALLATQTSPIEVAGEELETLAAPALLVHVALHAAHHGPQAPKALDEVERAVVRLRFDTWLQAAALAERLDALPAFAAGLRLAPAGGALAERLSLPRASPVDIALKAGGAPPLAVGLDWLLRTPGSRAKLALVARTALPSPGALRLWRPLARRGSAGLAAAYASHPFWLARHAVPSALAVRRARRRVETG
jgi:hypothetical protein